MQNQKPSKSPDAVALLGRLYSTEKVIQPVFVERSQINPEAKNEKDALRTWYEESEFFVTPMSVPQYMEIKAAINKAGGLHMAEASIFQKVIAYTLCTADGERLLEDNEELKGPIDDTRRSIYYQGLEVSGLQVPILRMVNGKPEVTVSKDPVAELAGNSHSTP